MKLELNLAAYTPEVGEQLSNHKPRILIEGPQGAGKTSLVFHLSTIFGITPARGFPTYEFIKSATSQEEICIDSIDRVIRPFDTPLMIYDRSPISQYAWLARNGCTLDEAALGIKEAMGIVSKHGPVIVAFIDSDPDSCASRQNRSTELSVRGETVSEEVSIYRHLFNELYRARIPGILVVQINNGFEVTEKDFIHNGSESIINLVSKK